MQKERRVAPDGSNPHSNELVFSLSFTARMLSDQVINTNALILMLMNAAPTRFNIDLQYTPGIIDNADNREHDQKKENTKNEYCPSTV